MENQPVQDNNQPNENGNQSIKQLLKWQYIAIVVAIIIGLSVLFGYLFSSNGDKGESSSERIETQKIEKKNHSAKDTYVEDNDVYNEENTKHEAKNKKEVKKDSKKEKSSADKPEKTDKPAKTEKPVKTEKAHKEDNTQKAEPETNDFSKMKVYKKIKYMPEFPGGEQKMNAFIAKNLRSQGKKGQVTVSFIVEPNGTLSNVQVKEGIGGACDQEAVRLVKSFPKWEPGRLSQNGKPVRVNINLPINFK